LILEKNIKNHKIAMSRRAPERSLPEKEQITSIIAAIPSRNTPSRNETVSPPKHRTPSPEIYRYRVTASQAAEAAIAKEIAEARALSAPKIAVAISTRSTLETKREVSPVTRERQLPQSEREPFRERELPPSEGKGLEFPIETGVSSLREPSPSRRTRPPQEKMAEKVRLILLDGTGLGDGEGEVKLIEASSYSEMADLYNEDWEEYVGEFIDKFTKLGDTSSEKIWVLIGRYHEYVITKKELKNGSIPNDISALIFANSLEEVKKLLKTHPAYIADIENVLKDDPDSGVEDLDVVKYIFGDDGQQLAQLCGDLVELPQEYRKYV
jgi:hypothetical protein